VTAFLEDLYLALASHLDGARLVEEALAGDSTLAGAHVLAVGKVARPMFEGLMRALGPPPSALLVSPAPLSPGRDPAPSGPLSPVLRGEGQGEGSVIRDLGPAVRLLEADHPHPSARSVAAADQARAFVAALAPSQRLVVLLSGGGSALLAAPRVGLSLEDKRATVAAVARAGATIEELNTVRKHLSAIKGGQLGLAIRAPTTVLALSDVIGNDPGTIASGPLSPDPTNFGQALALVRRLAPGAPPAAVALLERGASGGLSETPKHGDPRLSHVQYRVLAGPERVSREAHRLIEAGGHRSGTLATSTEAPVPELAAAYGARARQEARSAQSAQVLVGNGEPRIVVTGHGTGGRATHLALLMAREIAGLPDVSFLAAGTDERDGNAPASGAVVDGATWSHAVAAGLQPESALDECDSARPLAALGCLVRGPGRSNLLDVHLLAVSCLAQHR
jgi:glycerate 2-kinase